MPDAENGSFCRYSVSSSLKYSRYSRVVLNESQQKQSVFGAHSFNGTDFCRDKKDGECNIGHISEPSAAVSGENMSVKTVRCRLSYASTLNRIIFFVFQGGGTKEYREYFKFRQRRKAEKESV